MTSCLKAKALVLNPDFELVIGPIKLKDMFILVKSRREHFQKAGALECFQVLSDSF